MTGRSTGGGYARVVSATVNQPLETGKLPPELLASLLSAAPALPPEVRLGARIGDSVVSHWALYALGYRPNPGLSSTALYALEVVFLLSTFWKGLALAPRAAWVGVAVGALFFCLVLPTLRCLRIIPAWRREPWRRGEPLPAWTKD